MNLADPYRESNDKTLERLSRLTPNEVIELAKRAGICETDGKLASRYQSCESEDEKRNQWSIDMTEQQPDTFPLTTNTANVTETAYLDKAPLVLCGKCEKIASVKIKVKETILYLHRCGEHWQAKCAEETVFYV